MSRENCSYKTIFSLILIFLVLSLTNSINAQTAKGQTRWMNQEEYEKKVEESCVEYKRSANDMGKNLQRLERARFFSTTSGTFKGWSGILHSVETDKFGTARVEIMLTSNRLPRTCTFQHKLTFFLDASHKHYKDFVAFDPFYNEAIIVFSGNFLVNNSPDHFRMNVPRGYVTLRDYLEHPEFIIKLSDVILINGLSPRELSTVSLGKLGKKISPSDFDSISFTGRWLNVSNPGTKGIYSIIVRRDNRDVVVWIGGKVVSGAQNGLESNDFTPVHGWRGEGFWVFAFGDWSSGCGYYALLNIREYGTKVRNFYSCKSATEFHSSLSFDVMLFKGVYQ